MTGRLTGTSQSPQAKNRLPALPNGQDHEKMKITTLVLSGVLALSTFALLVPMASASCTVNPNLLDRSYCDGNCLINGFASYCSDGSCQVNQGGCSGGGTCPVNLVGTCSGSCLMIIVADCTGECTVVIGGHCRDEFCVVNILDQTCDPDLTSPLDA